MDFAATVAGSTDSAAPRRGAYVVGWGWVLLGVGDLAARVPRVRGRRAWEHMFFLMVREGFGGCQGRCGGRGPEGDGREVSPPLPLETLAQPARGLEQVGRGGSAPSPAGRGLG